MFRPLSTSRIGFRGGFLLTLAAIHILYGYSIMFPTLDVMTRPDTMWRNQYAPHVVWGTAWLVIAATCFVTAFMKQDRVGYGAAVGWLIFWSLQCVSSQIWGGYGRGYVTAGIFGAFMILTILASGQPEQAREESE